MSGLADQPKAFRVRLAVLRLASSRWSSIRFSSIGQPGLDRSPPEPSGECWPATERGANRRFYLQYERAGKAAELKDSGPETQAALSAAAGGAYFDSNYFKRDSVLNKCDGGVHECARGTTCRPLRCGTCRAVWTGGLSFPAALAALAHIRRPAGTHDDFWNPRSSSGHPARSARCPRFHIYR